MKSKENTYLNRRSRKIKTSAKKGLPPGSLVYIGDNNKKDLNLNLLRFNDKEIIDQPIENINELKLQLPNNYINWYQVQGINNPENIRLIGEQLQLDVLLLEDILNTDHRPKIETFDDYIFLILKTFSFNKETKEIKDDHFCIAVSDTFLISFQEDDHSLLTSLQTRIKTGKGKIKLKKYDYLLYAIIDLIVDSYFETVENISESMEELEQLISNNPKEDLLIEIEKYRKSIYKIRKLVLPLRDITTELLRNTSEIIEKDNEKFYRDVYDHTLHLIDSIEYLIETNSSIKDLYHSTMSLKMNQIMQVLTIYTVIFTPITFIAGIYGMNFINIPELQYKYGYFIALTVMVLIATGMLLYFKKKRWL